MKTSDTAALKNIEDMLNKMTSQYDWLTIEINTLLTQLNNNDLTKDDFIENIELLMNY